MEEQNINKELFKPGTDFFNQTIGYTEVKYHKHDMYEFFFIVCGQTEHILNGKKMTLKANDMILMRHKDFHMFTEKRSMDFLHTDIIISDEIVEKAKVFLNDNKINEYFTIDNPYILKLNSYEISTINNKINIIDSMDNEGKNKDSLILSLTVFLLGLISEKNIKPDDTNKPIWLKQLLSLLEFNSSLLKSREEIYKLLDTLSYNKSYISSAFKKHMGMTISQYINNLRMSTAYSLISTTDMNIDEIMEQVGINNKTFFYKKFKEKYMTTPDKIRKSSTI